MNFGQALMFGPVFEFKPNTRLDFYEDGAIRRAKECFSLVQLPSELYLFLQHQNGGTPVRQMFVTKAGDVLLLMTFFYLFEAAGRDWEQRIDDDINLLAMLDRFSFGANGFFPIAKTFAGDLLAYGLSGDKAGHIYQIEPVGQDGYDFPNATCVFDTLEQFVTAAR